MATLALFMRDGVRANDTADCKLPRSSTRRRGAGPSRRVAAARDYFRSGLSQTLHVNSGVGCPGSTITELNSPQRPHCRTTLVGSFSMGLVAAATAAAPWARSSALVSGGPGRRGLIGKPPLRTGDARRRSFACLVLPCRDPSTLILLALSGLFLAHEQPSGQYQAEAPAGAKQSNLDGGVRSQWLSPASPCTG
jgi:hypothetical protein